MNIPKIILPIFVGSILILILFSYSLPNEFSVIKSIEIKNSKFKVISYLSNLKNWEDFNPISSKDKDSKYTYIPYKDSLFYSVDWLSETEGKGKVILEITHSDSIKYSYEMYELNQKATGIFVINSINNYTKLTWIFKGKLDSNPVAKLLGYFSNNIFGYDMNKSLIKIKQKLEQN